MKWHREIEKFIELANRYQVKMILVGGGAVNFHGYQRNSVDVDFWIESSEDNLTKLIKVFKEMGYEIDDFPDKVKNRMQNISVKFSNDMELELITRFALNKSFDRAYKDSIKVEKKGNDVYYYNVISLNDLIESKIRSGREKDLIDIQLLKKINKNS